MKKIAKKILSYFGLQMSRSDNSRQVSNFDQDSMLVGIHRAKMLNINPTTIIDVGAAEGKWTLSTMEVWPESQYVLVEPLEERKQELQQLTIQHKNTHLVPAGAGAKKSTIDFFVTKDLDGSGIADNGTGARKVTIEITTIDDEVSRLGLPGPYCINLDTHGFEVPIFEGAENTLQQTELLIIECYGFQIAPNHFYSGKCVN